jgi:RimJ/RimL family protein N-acetyltransferase
MPYVRTPELEIHYQEAGAGPNALVLVHGNFASWRVAHSCGFAFEGARRLSLPYREGVRDGWHASLTPGDAPTARTIWWPVPVLEGDRVRLRAQVDTDLGRIMQGCADEVARRWLPNLPVLDTVEDARGYVTGLRLGESLGQRVTWAVADRADDRFLGQVGLFRLDDPMCPTGAEIGYWAHPDARGRGVVGEAVRLALAHAFTPFSTDGHAGGGLGGGLGRHRVQLGSAWSNAESRAVAERAGFTRLGRFRQDGLIGTADGEVYDDGVWYDLLATDQV